MPPHRLTALLSDTELAATAVYRVLTGAPVDQVASEAHMDPQLLNRMLDVFIDARHQAAREHTGHNAWWQADVNLDPTDRWAVHQLTNRLDAACSDGHVRGWWFLRKHPGWRLRLCMTTPGALPRLHDDLDTLVARGALQGWRPGVYEPETAAFGGPSGMAIAHDLFCADSTAIAHVGADTDLPMGRKQISVMLCTELMHAARLEPFEHGDVWDLVCALRPLPEDVTPEQVEPMLGPARTLTGADTSPHGAMFGADGPLRAHTTWAAAFSWAGGQLAEARQDGTLHRGIRQVVAYHVIFHWNRLGVSAGVQGALARAARAAILDIPVRIGACAR